MATFVRTILNKLKKKNFKQKWVKMSSEKPAAHCLYLTKKKLLKVVDRSFGSQDAFLHIWMLYKTCRTVEVCYYCNKKV